MTDYLYEEIERYIEKGIYPFHMPGAKRSEGYGKFSRLFSWDITEIEGFDDLRNPCGVLKALEDSWAKMYGAGAAFLSVTGSPAGNLSNIFAATSPKDKILITADCHISVENAAKLRGLLVVRLNPEREKCGVCGAISLEQIEEALDKEKDIKAAVITSPTYDGYIADIKKISKITKEHGVKLIVDAAHGAHLALKDFITEKDILSGADAAVVSLHKTLPVMGQVSLILIPKGSSIDKSYVKRYLNMFQTSSPSYVLMSSASFGLKILREDGERLFFEHTRRLASFYESAKNLRYLELIDEDNKDRSKILISTRNTCLSGRKLMSRLREKYSIEAEKCTDFTVLKIGRAHV